MLKTTIITVALGCMLGAAAPSYDATATVVSVDDASNTFQIVVHETGEMYRMYGVEDWMVGDGIRCKMDTMHTATTKDDIPVEMTYIGYGIGELAAYIDKYSAYHV